MQHKKLGKQHTAFVVTKAFLPLLIVGGMGVFLSFILFQFERTTLQQVYSEVFRESQYAAGDIKRLFSDKYKRSSADVKFLANQPTMRKYLNTLNTQPNSDVLNDSTSSLEQTFTAFINTSDSIYQLRVISVMPGSEGQEMVRVEGKDNKLIVSTKEQLQNKKNRDYYLPSSKLSDNQLFISELSLNKELGKIDYPYRPTLRFSVPLFTEDDKRIGFIIANVDMSVFLQELSDVRAPFGLFMLREKNNLFSYHYQSSLQYGRDLNPAGEFSTVYTSQPLLDGEMNLLTELFADKRELVDYSFDFVTASGSAITIHLLTKSELIENRLNERRQTFYILVILISVVFVFTTASVYRNLSRGRALKDAESSSRIKSDFISSVSHEMRTPLNGIVGALTLIDEQPKNQAVQKYLSIAKTSANILTTLINDILDLSKIEADKLELLPVRFEPVALIKNVMNLMSVTRHAKHIILSFDATKLNFAVVYADNNRITQVLNNLVSNALKFTESGTVVVTVVSEELSENRGYLHITVADTGIGITKENQKKLFKSFSQISNKISSTTRGSGLGLIISQKLCQLMGGDIKMESTLGKGTTVKCSIIVDGYLTQSNPEKQKVFVFPEQEGTQPEEALHTSSTSESAGDAWPHLSDCHVLIVDDNEINLEIARSLLAAMPVTFVTASDGEEALEVLQQLDAKQQTKVCVLMDCFMPNMDGYEATGAIRKGKAGNNMRSVAIVAMTANAMKGDKQKCLDAGMDDYLTKPFSKPVLIRMVDKQLRRVLNSQ